MYEFLPCLSASVLYFISVPLKKQRSSCSAGASVSNTVQKSMYAFPISSSNKQALEKVQGFLFFSFETTEMKS